MAGFGVGLHENRTRQPGHIQRSGVAAIDVHRLDGWSYHDLVALEIQGTNNTTYIGALSNIYMHI